MIKNNNKSNKVKLGFAYSVTSDGLDVTFSVNPEIGKIAEVAETDERSLYNILDFKEGLDKNVVRVISFSEEGCYFRILKYIPGRDGDNSEAWIFIPLKAAIEGEELVGIINSVTEVLMKTNIKEDKETLANLFAKEYDVHSCYPVLKASHGERKAYRFISGDKKELVELLNGNNLYQEYYTDYETVLLLNRNEAKVRGNLDNLSNQELYRWFKLTNKSGNGVSVFVDETEFHGCVMTLEGKHRIVYKKEGSKDCGGEIDVRSDMNLPDKPLNFMMELNYNNVYVFPEGGVKKDITDECTIEINKKTLFKNNSILISESELGNVKIDIKHNEELYRDLSKTIILQPCKKNIQVTLEVQKKEYTFKYGTKVGKELFEFKLAYQGAPEKSPINGHKLHPVSSQVYYIIPRWYVCIKHVIFLYIVIGFAIVTAFIGGMFVETPFVFQNTAQLAVEKGIVLGSHVENASVENDTQISQRSAEIDSLANYIKNNEIWEEKAFVRMNFICLYNMLNTYNFNELLNTYDTLLNNNEVCKTEWRTLIDAIKKAKKNEYQRPTQQSMYSNDGSITIKNYIEKITSM